MLLNSCKDGVNLNFRVVNVNRYIPYKTELNNEWSLLEKAFAIAKEANDIDSDFFDKYSEYLFATGERSIDYSGYKIPLDEEYSLFVAFSLDSYCIEKNK